MDEQSSGPKAHHTILGLEVTGGFLKTAKFEFTDGLNCIIGGRGTGKTTALEFVRYVLGQMPDQRASPSRAKAIGGLVQSNLNNGRIRLRVETKHGIRYMAERPWNDTSRVLNEQGEATAISFDRDLIFKADIYSQNEIEEIATNPSLQLALLDKFIEGDVRRIEGEIGKLDRDLSQNAAELIRLDREIRDLREGVSEVPALEEKLKALQQIGGPDANVVNAAHSRRALREKERQTLEALRADISEIAADFDSLVSGAVRRLRSRIDEDVANGQNKEVFQYVSKQVDELASLLERGNTRIGQQCSTVDEAVSGQEWVLEGDHAKQDAEYRSLVERSQEESGRAMERAQLDQRYAEVTAARKELELCKKERSSREVQRRELTAKLSGRRDVRFGLRKKVAEQLSTSLNPSIRVTVMQAGNRDGYQELLNEALKGSNMKYAALVERIVQGASPEEFSALVQRGDAAQLAERTGLDEERAERVIELVGDTELLYRIETVELEDLPQIELLDGEYKDSAELSTGQRCTTILPILLLESERPLLIDQPEDNLDNAFIYETVVKSLKGAKGKRQLIFVTHNPNIPVLGDAERVFVLGSDGKQGSLTKVGTVDELKQEIELLLEGGSEAFLLRKKRYGH